MSEERKLLGIKKGYIKKLNEVIKYHNDLDEMCNNPEEPLNEKIYNQTIKKINKDKINLESQLEKLKQIEEFNLPDFQSEIKELLNKYHDSSIPSPPVKNLNYDNDIYLINLRDIRFSQIITSEILDSHKDLIENLNKYPFKFYNYNQNLVLLGMFGEEVYGDTSYSSHPPTVPALRVVQLPEPLNCYVSVDNRRLVTIYILLCILLNTDDLNNCLHENIKLKDTYTFLYEELNIPNYINIYIPCYLEQFTDTPSRFMKTPEGEKLVALQDTLNGLYNYSGPEPNYAGVIWDRVTGQPIDNYAGNPLEGFSYIPVPLPVSNRNQLNVLIQEHYKDIFQNKEKCRHEEDIIKGPIPIRKIIDILKYTNIIHSRDPSNQEEKREVLRNTYHYIANLFIDFLINDRIEEETIGNSEYSEYINYEDLYDNTIKFLPNLELWKDTITMKRDIVKGGKKTKTYKKRSVKTNKNGIIKTTKKSLVKRRNKHSYKTYNYKIY